MGLGLGLGPSLLIHVAVIVMCVERRAFATPSFEKVPICRRGPLPPSHLSKLFLANGANYCIAK